LTCVSDSSERLAIVHWLNGAAESNLAEAIGASSLPVGERQKEIKRFKDRIRKRLRRQLTAVKNGRHQAP
jgi:hypothetical protein